MADESTNREFYNITRDKFKDPEVLAVYDKTFIDILDEDGFFLQPEIARAIGQAYRAAALRAGLL